jgi:hypothetical protein
MNTKGNAIIAVLVVVVIVLAGWFAYREGYFQGTQQDDSEINIDLNGDDNSSGY